MVDLRDCLLDSAEFLSLDSANRELPPGIKDKILAAKPLLASSHVIPVGTYSDIYATSDLHSDLPKCITLLAMNGLIEFDLSLLPTYRDHLHSIEWIAPPGTFLVLAGDIVDGTRSAFNFVPDSIGNMELVLHAFLYNLRIKARLKGSELRFTVGNHDYFTVLAENEGFALNPMYLQFVSSNAKRFFLNDRENRSNVLLPFYFCCPYVFVTVDKELAFVHAGLVEPILLEQMTMVQEELTRATTVDAFSAIFKDDRYKSVFVHKDSPILTRDYYGKGETEVCGALIPNSTYTMVIVGHCVTSQRPEPAPGQMEPSLSTVIKQEKSYTDHHCDTVRGHCVLVGCNDADGPRLALVDIGNGRLFTQQPFEANKHRAEILHLHHDPAAAGPRYYNTISRDAVEYALSGSQDVDIIVPGSVVRYSLKEWTAPPLQGGRRRRTRRHRNKGRSRKTKNARRK